MALLLVAVSCASNGAGDDAGSDRRRGGEGVAPLETRSVVLPDEIRTHFERGLACERDGKLERALEEYELVAKALPPRRYTRPWLSAGRVALALHREDRARAALEEAVAAVPDDPGFYAENDDYREAAILLAPLLARAGAKEELSRLRTFFLLKLGGTPEEWPLR